MNITTKKQSSEFDDEIKKILLHLKYKNSPLLLMGSASLKMQKYYSDFDFISTIEKLSPKESYDEFTRILKYILSQKNFYLTEIKLQTKNDDKIRWYPDDIFDEKEFKKNYKNMKFLKIDFIVLIDYKFYEISIIYSSEKLFASKESFIKSLQKNIIEYEKEEKYFKVLKRLFRLFIIEHKLTKAKILNEMLNSKYGEIYQKISNLEALKKIDELYKDDQTQKKINIVLKHMKIKKNDIDKYIDTNYKLINKEAKKFIEKNNL
jgi:hypothetical protein